MTGFAALRAMTFSLAASFSLALAEGSFTWTEASPFLHGASGLTVEMELPPPPEGTSGVTVSTMLMRPCPRGLA